MARNQRITVPATGFVELTNASVSQITFQVATNGPVQIVVTTGSTPPTDTTQALRYDLGEGELNRALSDLCPGIAGTRIFAKSSHFLGSEVFVSHA